MKNGIRSIRFSLAIFCTMQVVMCHKPEFIALIGAGIPIFSIGIKRRAGLILNIVNDPALPKNNSMLYYYFTMMKIIGF
ncbi:hypothetical protein [Pedobacter sp. P26]|uniref:hypothetical protein n=1 Tax=Pedobacter sp. P26 TaxID=3423956 RepID=UPI003D6738AE